MQHQRSQRLDRVWTTMYEKKNAFTVMRLRFQGCLTGKLVALRTGHSSLIGPLVPGYCEAKGRNAVLITCNRKPEFGQDDISVLRGKKMPVW